VVVSHRLSAVRDLPLVLVLDGGRVVEQGDHETLLARGGYYRELSELQEMEG
jgi:ABC-type multidrug transport system fused ATPase/permease subunit